MSDLYVPRVELDALAQSPVLFDALIAEDDTSLTFEKMVTRNDPGVASQRVTESVIDAPTRLMTVGRISGWSYR